MPRDKKKYLSPLELSVQPQECNREVVAIRRHGKQTPVPLQQPAMGQSPPNSARRYIDITSEEIAAHLSVAKELEICLYHDDHFCHKDAYIDQ